MWYMLVYTHLYKGGKYSMHFSYPDFFCVSTIYPSVGIVAKGLWILLILRSHCTMSVHLTHEVKYMKVQIGLTSKANPNLGEAILVPSQEHLHVCICNTRQSHLGA